MKQEEDEADDKDEVLSMEEALADQDEQLRLDSTHASAMKKWGKRQMSYEYL